MAHFTGRGNRGLVRVVSRRPAVFAVALPTASLGTASFCSQPLASAAACPACQPKAANSAAPHLGLRRLLAHVLHQRGGGGALGVARLQEHHRVDAHQLPAARGERLAGM